MTVEDVETSPNKTTFTDYATGARGVDGISTSVNGAASTVAYPIYDAHGNMIATLAKGGSNTYSVGNQRSYDAWGGIRIGNLTGDPKQQYCANLGHRADDETGFVYMRARYYEPSTARFLSEDPGRQGINLYAYAENSPTNKADGTGKNAVDDFYAGLIGGFLLALFLDIKFGEGMNLRIEIAGAVAGGIMAFATTWLKEEILELTEAKALNLAGKILTSGLGLAAGIATLYGMRAGEILFQLMLIDYESSDEFKAGRTF